MAICPNCHDTNSKAGLSCPQCDDYYYIPEDSVDDAAHDQMIGRMAADKYVILGLINEGGMGAVYRALQMPVEREVALKVLRTELKDSDQAGDRFIREARAVSRLNHPNIITLFDFGFDSDRHPYMVMEYAPGVSLGKWLKKPDVTIERIVSVSHQVLSALSEAHKQGIVHRDLKPENMIVTETSSNQDTVKLLDFGIARLINEGATKSLTRDGEVFGTPHYMAPEQAQGKKNVGPAADVYAMGIMLYEMIVGRCPFDAPTPLAVLFMHINDVLPDIVPKSGIALPETLREVIAIATAKEPENRYQDASEMLVGLGEVVQELNGSGGLNIGVTDLTGELRLPGRVGAMTPMPQPSDIQSATTQDTSFPPYEAPKNKKGGIIIVGLVTVCVLLLAGIGVMFIGEDETTAEEAVTIPEKMVEKAPEVETPEKTDGTEVAIKDTPDTKEELKTEELKIEDPATDTVEIADVDEKKDDLTEKPEPKVTKKKVRKSTKKSSAKKVTKKAAVKPKVDTTSTPTNTGPKKFQKKPTKFGIK